MIYPLANGQMIRVSTGARPVDWAIKISFLAHCRCFTEQKEFGFLYREHQKTLFKSMKKWWLEEIHVSSEDYDRVCQEALKEFDEYRSFVRWRVFTARKPL